MCNHKAILGVTKAEIGHLVEEMNMDIIHTMATQMDALQDKRKQEEENQDLGLSYPVGKKKHLNGHCPYNWMINSSIK